MILAGAAVPGRPRRDPCPHQSHARPAVAAIALALALAAAGLARAAGEVSGKYVGNGTPAKLAHALVVKHEDFSGKKAYTVVLTEKDPAKQEKPDFWAAFGKLGHALIINVNVDGEIFGTQVAHQGLEKGGFSSIGSLQVEGFKLDGGTLSARFFTDGVKEFSGDKWEADLTVKAPLPK